MKLIQMVAILVLGFAVGCGGPRDKSQKNNKDIVINNGSNNTDPNNTNLNNVSNKMTCGVSCDDRNACTVDTTQTDADCSTSCRYEIETQCVAGDGCCPTGCTTDNDGDCGMPNTDPMCTASCQPSSDSCYAVVTSRDNTGCVVGCDYAPITTCVGGDGCCPSGCSFDTDSDCEEPANNDNNANNQNNCTPQTCGGLGAVCGSLADGCGGTLSCGSCSTGQECTPDGQCVEEREGCDPNQPGVCPANAPYCVMSSCVACIGDADCMNSEICIDGFCADSPDCTVNPGACPTGYDCVSGNCELPTGQACDPQDPVSCPQGTFCDQTTATCVAAGGANGCGLCNADCTCPGSLTCDGMLCGGCSSLGGPDEQCPDGQVCFDLLGAPLCLPFG